MAGAFEILGDRVLDTVAGDEGDGEDVFKFSGGTPTDTILPRPLVLPSLKMNSAPGLMYSERTMNWRWTTALSPVRRQPFSFSMDTILA